MKFIARVQNLHFNFSCHSLGCGQIPSACLNCSCAAPVTALRSPRPHTAPLCFWGAAEDNCKPLFLKLKESKAGQGGLQRLVAVAFHYIAAFMAKQGVIFLMLHKLIGVEFFPLQINYAQGFTWEEVGTSQGRRRLRLDLQEGTRYPLPRSWQGSAGLHSQIHPHGPGGDKLLPPHGEGRGGGKSWRPYLRNWRRGRRKGSRIFWQDKFGERGR